MARKKRRITALKINEISGVDNPAQVGASVLIMKRSEKGNALQQLDNAAVKELILDMFSKGDINMSKTAEELQKALDAQKAETERLVKVLALSAEHREHYNGLEDAAKAGFLEKSEAERTAIVAKANEPDPEDPVVFKTEAGVEIRKSDGPAVLALAKSNDEQLKANRELAKKLAESEARRGDQQLRKRAETELKYFPGDLDTRVAILKSVEAIESEEARKAALQSLKAQNDALSTAFKVSGHLGTPEPGSASEELDKLTKALVQKDTALTYEQAYDKVLGTEEGAKLYAQTIN